MPVDREQWATEMESLPHWDCPTCGKGRLKLIEDSLRKEESARSIKGREIDAWEPDWIENRFVALVKCDAPTCGEVATVSGDASVEVFEDCHLQERWTEDRYSPLSIIPAPLPIRLPQETPDEVKEALQDSASLMLLDPEASANKIRQAVEHLMDARRVKKTTIGKAKKRARLSLHARIVEFTKKDPEVGGIVEAIKWLGNSGSHVGKLTREDVFDAFDMIEHVLEDLYGKTRAKIMAKAKLIKKRKGALKRK